MPARYAVDSGRTFSHCLLLQSGPKIKFGTQGEPDVAADGQRKWRVQVAATFTAEPGRQPFSDLLDVTILGGADPAQGIPAGTPVEFEGLIVSTMPAEAGENGRVRGGKPWHMAKAVRAANGRPAGKE
jgi:hypothetical protein